MQRNAAHLEPAMNQPVAARPTTAPALGPAEVRTILIGIMLAMFLGALDQTIVVTALPTIARELNDVRDLAWVVTAYLLTATAVTPIYGKLSDIAGRRPMLLMAIAVFLVGSVACALARNIHVLIAARALQGLGGGGLLSLAQTVIGDVVPPRERGRYQAYFAAVFVTSSLLGPVLGGLFAEHLHWSLIFWINLPIAAVAYAMTNRVLRRLPRHEVPHRLDLIGAALMVVATVSLLLLLTWGGVTYSWASPPIVTLAVITAAAWGLFVLRLLTAPEPFVPLAVLRNPVVSFGVIAGIFGVGTTVGLSVFVPLYFEGVLGLSASASGLALVGLMASTVIGANLAARVMHHYDRYKWAATAGLALSTAAMALLAAFPTSLGLVGFVAVLTAGGVGMGTIYPISTVAIQNAVEPHQMGTTTGVLNFFRSLGGAVFVAGFSAIFFAFLSADIPHVSIEQAVIEGARAGVNFGPVFRGVFGASAIALFLAFLAMAAMEERPLRRHAGPSVDGPAAESRSR
jgi:EmrB/QacA subfamily drug resistance transporter